MEIYLNNDNFSFRLPVLPSTINIQDYSIMNDSNITGLGDVTIFGGKGLRTTELTSFFPNPNRNYKFVSYTDSMMSAVNFARGNIENVIVEEIPINKIIAVDDMMKLFGYRTEKEWIVDSGIYE